MTPHLIKFDISHLGCVTPRDGDPAERIQLGMDLLRQHDHLAFTAVLGEKIIACAGVCPGVAFGEDGETVRDPKAGYVWVLASPEVETYRFWFHRNVKRYLRGVIREFRFSWVMTAVIETSKRNCEWIERLGFQAKGKLTFQGVPACRYVLEVK